MFCSFMLVRRMAQISGASLEYIRQLRLVFPAVLREMTYTTGFGHVDVPDTGADNTVKGIISCLASRVERI